MKSLLLLVMALLTVSITNAQMEQPALQRGSLHEGFVVLTNGDTIHGFIKFTTFIANQFNVHLFNQKSDPKPSAKYKPKDLKAYSMGTIRYTSVPFSGKGVSRNKSLMISLVEGPVRLYKWFYDESLMLDGQDLNEATGRENVLTVDLDEGIAYQYFGVRGREKPVDFSSVKYGMNFKKHMSKYVSDYPELSGKIASRQPGYGYDNLDRIIEEYNAWLLGN
jgi:hypothetical protein